MGHPYVLLLLLFSLIPGFAQTNHSPVEDAVQPHGQPIRNQFEHLSVNDGLSNNSVNCILQDRAGYMWFGTSDGLNKYDGQTFTVFKPNLTNPAHSFQNNQIAGFCEDHQNRLWVATQGGLHEIDERIGRVIPHLIWAANAERWNCQHSIFEDSQRRLWISTLAGIACYEPTLQRFTLFAPPHLDASIKTVFEDMQHRFWVATYQGLYRFEPSTGRYTLLPVRGVPRVKQPAFMAFYLDKQQVLWLATATAGYGLFRLDLRRQPWQLESYNPHQQINPYTFLNSMHKDAAGIIWLATTAGLQHIDPIRHQVFTCHPDLNAPKGISSNTAQTVYHDRAGTLWVGTDNGIDRQTVTTKPFMNYQVRVNNSTVNLPENKIIALLPTANRQFWLSNGLTVYRPQNNRSALVPPRMLGSTSQSKNHVQALASDGSNGVWLGTWEGLYYYNPVTDRFTKYPSEVPAEYISCAPDSTLWVGGNVTPSSGIASFNPRTHRYRYYKYNSKDAGGWPNLYIYGLLVSQTGDIWVLFQKQGIGRLNPKTGRFVYYKAGPVNRLNSSEILTIHQDNAGTIWVGTQQGGVNRFDARTGLFSALTTRDGLLSNTVVGITSDRTGQVWLSTDKGLSRLNPETKAIRNYQTTNGLASNNFLRNAVARRGNQLFFGSLNGVVYFNPDSIRDDTRPFPVYITALTVLDKPRSLTGNIVTLNHDENFLSFRFAALEYTHPNQNQYVYQLVGVDQNWVQNGTRNVANYTNLSPGNYTFRVKAANSDGIWSRQKASLTLIIRPPWWQTWWAYCLYVLLVGAVIRGLVHTYTNRVRQQQELEVNRREAEQLKTVDELKTRFFSNITHEFRTPLSLIISPVDKLLQDTHFDAQTRQTLALVQRNADQLLRLINQLLDLSKLEANRMAVALVQGNAGDFVGTVVDSFRQAAEQKQVSLLYTVTNSPSAYQLFDGEKWEKILTNLLSNALKFTQSGGTVAVELTPVSADDTEEVSAVQIRITDTGIGIVPENLSHIFDRFYQIDNSYTRAYEGTGIGLSLTKELVDLLGGTITVESRPNVGTTFQVTLPVLPITDSMPVLPAVQPVHQHTAMQPIMDAVTAHSVNEAVGERLRILVVEDNDELREFLANELAAHYEVLRAINGERGWELTLSELPDIVISDVMMPRMDGYELTHRIKNHPDTDHIAVLLLTAKAAHQSRIEGLQEGADDYLSKPFHLDELQLRLHNILAHQQKLREQYRQRFPRTDSGASACIQADAFLHRVYELLENHLSDPDIDVEWLADQVAMSRKTLYRKIHSLLHLTPNELIRQYRLRKAADLLRAGYTASQTAYATGFKSPSHFATVFREFYQKTPTEFGASGVSNTN